MTNRHAPTRGRGIVALFFLFLLSVYLFFSGDRYTDFPVSDEWVMFSTTISLAEQGSIRPALDARYRGQEAKYGLGLSLAAVPLYLVSRALMPLLPEDTPPTAIAFPLACATNAWICAAVGAMFLATAMRLGYSRRTAIVGALSVGTTTILAAYSKSFFSEPLAALCLLGAIHSIAAVRGIHFPRPFPTGPAFLAGLWLAFAVLTRPDNVVVIPIFLATLWLGIGKVSGKSTPPTGETPQAPIPAPQSGNRLAALHATAVFFIPLVLMAAFILWTNYVRSGHHLQLAGYGSEGFSTFLPTGLFGLLLSPAHGVFWFSPPLALALAYAVPFHRRHPRVAFAVFATVLVKLFIFAKWWNWFGGWNWGSRFLLPVVPLGMLALLEPLSRWRSLRHTEKALIAAVCIAGLAVQVCGLLVNPTAYHGATQFLAGSRLRELTGQVQPLAEREQLLMFSPPQSPLAGSWVIIEHGRLDWFGVRFGQFFPPRLLAWFLGIFAVAAGTSAWRLVSAIRKEPSERDCEPVETLPVANLCPYAGRQFKIATLVFLLNIGFLCGLMVALRGNGLRCTERREDAHGQIIAHPVSRPIVYLDDDAAFPSGLRSLDTEWTGFLEAPVSGEYIFYTVAQGAFDLEIGGRLVLKNESAGGRRSQRAEVTLERGIHPICLRYAAPLVNPPESPADRSGPSDPTDKTPRQIITRLMHLYWTVPGGGEYQQVIRRVWLYPDYPSPQRQRLAQIYRLKFGFIVVSVIALWWIWLNSAFRLKKEDLASNSACVV